MNDRHDSAGDGAATASMKRLPDPRPGSIVVCTLGGVAAIGMNFTLYGTAGPDGTCSWVLVDAGTSFAPREVAGVEAIMPEPTVLTALGSKLKGLLVSHYHEDHVGAITRLWPRFLSCPIFAPPFAARMLTAKFQDKGVRGDVKIETFQPGSSLKTGPFRIRTIRVAHSTPDCVAFGFEAQGRRILQTNDWKIDDSPGIGSRTDLGAFAQFGRAGVDLMLCDSTNAEREAPPTSEASVRRALEAVMRDTRGIVFVCSFGSNVARMASVAQAAKATRRKVALAGRALRDAAEAAEHLGLMKGVPRFLDDPAKLAATQRNGCVVMCTGTQGEENASLMKLAKGSDRRLPRVQHGDTVVMSARAIPGNEDYILAVIERLRAQGARIVTAQDRFGDDTVHVTGHPVRDDLRVMYDAVKPRFALPVHGSPMHLAAHAALARECAVERAFEPVNGGVYELSANGLTSLGRIAERLVAVLGDGSATMVPWDDVAKAAVLTEAERRRLDAHLERERARSERSAEKAASQRGGTGGNAGAVRGGAGERDRQRQPKRDAGRDTAREKPRRVRPGEASTRDKAPVRGGPTRPFEVVVARNRVLRPSAGLAATKS